MTRNTKFRKVWVLVAAVSLAIGLVAPTAFAAGPDPDHTLARPEREDSLAAHDVATTGVVSSGPTAKIVSNVDLRGRGERLDPGSTTDVWVLGNYAYTGTFQSPCGGDDGAGVWIWDVRNPNKTSNVGIIASPTGSRSNDVKVASMNSGDVLVHSNESCGGGPGGFEIYNVDDPENPVSLASVQTDDVNLLLRDGLGFTDFGVHNLFLFTQGSNDYVGVVVESEFGNFQIFDITDPTSPSLVGFWGAEQLHRPDVADWVNLTDFDVILDADAYLFSGFGASQNRFLHDITITADGTQAYLANWDAGLVLLDISDVTDPQLVSAALDPAGSLDAVPEINSHAVWPSEDGSIVVEGEEDFAAFALSFSITSGPNIGDYPTAEGTFTTPLISLPGGTMSGSTTYVGLACTGGDPVPAGSGIALVQRGACRFDDKATNAINAGYDGMVVFNDAARGDALVGMGGDPRPIPGVFVGHSTGLAIAGVGTAADLVIGDAGADVAATAFADAWSGLRIWDYSDPANPVLASTFNTTCAADPADSSCDLAGTYSVHNVQVETTGNKVMAYVSWYSDGMLVIDVSDPYNPVETARFLDDSTNGGQPNDFWGVYKVPNGPFFYGSDRNGGLYIFKEQGSGSGD